MTLTDIANRHGTDKGTSSHEKHGYAARYEELIRAHPSFPRLRLLEIGVWDTRFTGASTRMWREFMPECELFAIDTEPASRSLESECQMRVFIVDQSDRHGLRDLVKELGHVDFVVDDGSHALWDVGASLEELWPLVTPGGAYLVEDLHCPVSQPRHELDAIVARLADVGSTEWSHGEKLLVLRR